MVARIPRVVIGEKIKDFRQKNNLSQQAFAKLMQVTPQAISNWEREQCYPDITYLPMLAAYLGCCIDDLFE